MATAEREKDPAAVTAELVRLLYEAVEAAANVYFKPAVDEPGQCEGGVPRGGEKDRWRIICRQTKISNNNNNKQSPNSRPLGN